MRLFCNSKVVHLFVFWIDCMSWFVQCFIKKISFSEKNNFATKIIFLRFIWILVPTLWCKIDGSQIFQTPNLIKCWKIEVFSLFIVFHTVFFFLWINSLVHASINFMMETLKSRLKSILGFCALIKAPTNPIHRYD